MQGMQVCVPGNLLYAQEEDLVYQLLADGLRHLNRKKLIFHVSVADPGRSSAFLTPRPGIRDG